LDDHDLTSDSTLLRLSLVVFVLMAALAGMDLVADLGEGTSAGHVLAEAAILVLGLAGAGFVARMLLSLSRAARDEAARAQTLAGQLAEKTSEAERYRSEARDLMLGLSRAVDAQFDRWQLSPAEKEVGLLLLKGLSHREVAQVRQVSEATARQQARALYRKAQLSGRHELAAFFLEDLMLPPQSPSAPGG
jgi:DNA-binding NarL/FixJ family response regulator